MNQDHFVLRAFLKLVGQIALGFVLVSSLTPSALAAPKSKSPKFLLGADVTALDAPGRAGRAPLTYQEDGKPSDEVTILMRHGWNAFRIRVFVSPVRNAPNNTLEDAIPLAKQIKAAGAVFLLDIHFSDTWADPGHQEIPVAWRSMDIDALANQWQQYAHDTVKAFKDAGAMPDMVQVGNEITRGVAWPIAELQPPGSSTSPNSPRPPDDTVQWDHLIRLLKAGITGVKSGAGDTPPRIAIHIDKGGNWDTTEWFFDHITAAHVQYDIIAQSFYPPWGHGTLDDLWTNMKNCAKRYHKDFLVAETGYGPPHGKNNDMLWPITPQGRLQFMVDLVDAVKKAPRGIGVMYWAPERDAWNEDGTPGPAVFTLDNLKTLTKRPDSKAPTAVHP
jgi:arabinogalactan endo-1,4-beta-galactosidase